MVTIMLRQRILLLLLLLPITLGIATFATLQYAISKDGVLHAPGSPHTAPATHENGHAAPAASEQKDADLSTPPGTNQRKSPAANPANRPAAPIPAQNDSAEVYGPARFAASIEVLEEPFGLIPTTSPGSIRLAAFSRSHALRGGGGGVGGGGGGGGGGHGAAEESPDNAANGDASPPADTNDENLSPAEGGDGGPPPVDGDVPESVSPPLLPPPDSGLYTPVPPGPSDGSPPPHVSVPEPASLGLLGLGLLGCAFRRKRSS